MSDTGGSAFFWKSESVDSKDFKVKSNNVMGILGLEDIRR